MALTKQEQLKKLAKKTGRKDLEGTLAVTSAPGVKPTGSGNPLGTKTIGGTKPLEANKPPKDEVPEIETPKVETGSNSGIAEFDEADGVVKPDFTNDQIAAIQAELAANPVGGPGFKFSKFSQDTQDFLRAQNAEIAEAQAEGQAGIDKLDFFQQGEKTNFEDSIELQKTLARLRRAENIEGLERGQAGADSAFVKGREGVISDANISAAKGFSRGVERKLDIINTQKLIMNDEISRKRKEMQQLHDLQQFEAAKGLADQITNIKKNQNKLNFEKAELIDGVVEEQTKSIVEDFGDALGEATNFELFEASGGNEEIFNRLKANRDRIQFADKKEVEKTKIAQTKQSWSNFKSLSTGQVATFSSAQSAEWDKALGLASGTTASWVLDAQENDKLSKEEKELANSKLRKEMNDAESGQDAKASAKEKDFKFGTALMEAGKVEEGISFLEGAGFDTSGLRKSKAQGGDMEVVAALANIATGETWIPENGVSSQPGECGGFLNNLTGIPSLMRDTIEQKTDNAYLETKGYVEVDGPVPGGIWVSNLSSANSKELENYGHCGAITAVNDDGTFNVKDSNRNNEGLVAERFNRTKKDEQIVKFYAPMAKEDAVQDVDIRLFNDKTSFRNLSKAMQTKVTNAKNEVMRDPEASIEDIVRFSQGGGTLTDTQSKRMDSIQSSLLDLQQINEAMEGGETGPLLGILRSKNPLDVNAKTVESALIQAVPGLARGVFGEVGVLTDTDIERYKATLPNLSQTKDVQKAITALLLRKLGRSYKSALQSFAASGRDVSGFEGLFKNTMTQIDNLENDLLEIGGDTTSFTTSSGKTFKIETGAGATTVIAEDDQLELDDIFNPTNQ